MAIEFVERGSSRATYQRCPKKWYWRYKLGLIPKEQSFGATDLGTWVHEAKATWYQDLAKGSPRIPLYLIFNAIAEGALFAAKEAGAPDHILEKGDELALLGEAMCKAYEAHYNSDQELNIIAVEQELEFRFPVQLRRDGNWIEAFVKHMLKPDAVYRDKDGHAWLLETKTTRSIDMVYLALDGQARPYASMAERALRRIGVLGPEEPLRGVMYDFLRKGWPDERETDSEGYALNRDGTRSKRQPTPLFLRHPVMLSRKAKAITLNRVRLELGVLANYTDGIRRGEISPELIPKTTNKSCTRCEFFKMCVTEENGGNIRPLMEQKYVRRDPYTYDDAQETEERGDFDMG
jgi:hypothetical protein